MKKMTVRGVPIGALIKSDLCPAITRLAERSTKECPESIAKKCKLVEEHEKLLPFFGLLLIIITIILSLITRDNLSPVIFGAWFLYGLYAVVDSVVSYYKNRRKISKWCEKISFLDERLSREIFPAAGIVRIPNHDASVAEALIELIQRETTEQVRLERKMYRYIHDEVELEELRAVRKKVHETVEEIGFEVGGYEEFFAEANRILDREDEARKSLATH